MNFRAVWKCLELFFQLLACLVTNLHVAFYYLHLLNSFSNLTMLNSSNNVSVEWKIFTASSHRMQEVENLEQQE